ncbi:hypothetical protein ACP4OV_003819 [Aristida adscensionis]
MTIRQTHLKIPIPALVLTPQSVSTQDTSGESNANLTANIVAKDVAEAELSPSEAM